jgi:cation:H+ antiporter
VVLRLVSPDLEPPAEALLFGSAIVGAAFLLSWAAETAQLDISPGLATAVLAFIAVLPEYAVDLVFAWKGGSSVRHFGAACPGASPGDDSPCSLALANMTGANRLLIGIGWSLVIVVAWWQWRRQGRAGSSVTLERGHAVELSFLTLATLYCLALPLRRSVNMVDAAVLVGLFLAYVVRVMRAPAEQPELVGPARYLATFTRGRRRLAVVALFLVSAAVILLCAEPFAEALRTTGRDLGVSQFVLVQWLAPLASEAPELLVATLFAWRLRASAGLGTLVSAKVNQWTLLVGTLPLVFALASGSHHGLPIDSTQRQELLALFWAQFLLGAVVPASIHGTERVLVSVVYLGLGALVLLRDRRRMMRLLRDGFRTPYYQLASRE